MTRSAIATLTWLATLWIAVTAGVAPISAAEAFDHRALATATLDRVIRPGAAGFAAKAAVLEASMTKLCAAPSAQALRTARADFKAAARAYARIEFLNFGPSRTDNRRERLLLYPDPKGLVRRHVEKALAERDPKVTEAAALANKSVALQGFSALELLLFAADAQALSTASEVSVFRCQYASAASMRIAVLARAIRDEWADPQGYAAAMLNPGPDNTAYLEAREVTREIVQSLIEGLDTTRVKRLAAPMGMIAPDKPPTAALLGEAKATLQFVTGSLEGLKTLYQAGGLQAAVARQDKAIARLVSAELTTALQALATVKGDIGSIKPGTDAWQRLLSAGFPLKNAQQQAGGQLAQAAGITMGFNAGDGD